jgi:hypothetical protein
MPGIQLQEVRIGLSEFSRQREIIRTSGELLPACPRPVTPVMAMIRVTAERQLELRNREH